MTFIASRQIIEGKDDFAMIGSLGMPELLFILVLALLIFGPRKLPDIGRTMGKAMGEFRRATRDLKRTLDVELSAEEASRPAEPAQVGPPPPGESPASSPATPETEAPGPPESPKAPEAEPIVDSPRESE